MAEKKDSIWRLAIVLTCISLLAALALTGVYALTKGPIEQGQREKKEKALAELDALLEHSIERGGGIELSPESYYESFQERRASREESNIPA